MSEDTKRTTIYFDSEIHRALRLKAANRLDQPLTLNLELLPGQDIDMVAEGFPLRLDARQSTTVACS